MKTTLTRLAVLAFGAAALVPVGATAASAATVPAHVSAAAAPASVVQPAESWHLYGDFATLAECQVAAIELMSYGAYDGYQCSLTDGAHQMEALYVYF
jgi:hypothetical protein